MIRKLKRILVCVFRPVIYLCFVRLCFGFLALRVHNVVARGLQGVAKPSYAPAENRSDHRRPLFHGVPERVALGLACLLLRFSWRGDECIEIGKPNKYYNYHCDSAKPHEPATLHVFGGVLDVLEELFHKLATEYGFLRNYGIVTILHFRIFVLISYSVAVCYLASSITTSCASGFSSFFLNVNFSWALGF